MTSKNMLLDSSSNSLCKINVMRFLIVESVLGPLKRVDSCSIIKSCDILLVTSGIRVLLAFSRIYFTMSDVYA